MARHGLHLLELHLFSPPTSTTKQLNNPTTNMAQSTKNETDPPDKIQARKGCYGSPCNSSDHVMDEAELHDRDMGIPIKAGQDDAIDLVGEFSLPRKIQEEPSDLSKLSPEDQSTKNVDEVNELHEPFLAVPIPGTSAGPSTFAYQRALRNRIGSLKLARGGDYDTRAFTPIFVHDCLMLPGSLANVLGKVNDPILCQHVTHND